MTVGARIMQLRLNRGYTREQLAYLADISEKFLYEIETDKKGFSATTLMGISKALEVSLDYIMYGSEEEIVSTLKRFNPNTLKRVERLLDVLYEITVKGNN